MANASRSVSLVHARVGRDVAHRITCHPRVTDRTVARLGSSRAASDRVRRGQGETMSYSAEINRATPACLVLLIDQSHSMNEPWGSFGTRAQALALTVNRLLMNA